MKLNDLVEKLERAGYFASDDIGYSLLCAIEMGIPLLVEGDPGVGKSSLAVAAAKALDVPLIRVQCYEGIAPDSVLYDYDYQRQLLVVSAIRDKLNHAMKDMSVEESIRYVAERTEFYGEDFLLERPILKALRQPGRKVLLIDEIDKASEEIEHALLEALSDFALTIPEYGTIRCAPEDMPIVVLTSNRYRELSSALKRRCAYLHIKKKTKDEIFRVLQMTIAADDTFCKRAAQYLDAINSLDLQHPSSISEGIAWAKFLKESMGEWDESRVKSELPYSVCLLAKNDRDRDIVVKRLLKLP